MPTPFERQIKEIEVAQAAASENEEEGRGGRQGRSATLVLLNVAALIRPQGGIGQIGAVTLTRAAFYRHFDNRREVASYSGLRRARSIAAPCAWIKDQQKAAIRVFGTLAIESPGFRSGTNRRVRGPAGSCKKG